MVIRILVSGISLIGRATQGVKVMCVKEGDTVQAVARLVTDNGDEKDPDQDENGAEEDGVGDTMVSLDEGGETGELAEGAMDILSEELPDIVENE